MSEQEHVRPLAPASVPAMSDGDGDPATSADFHNKILRRRKCIRCSVCVSAIFLIPVITIIILIFTVFRVKDPIITMNGVTITRLELIKGTQIPKPGTNMSMIVDVSVKNPNKVSFKYSNTTTAIYYRNTEVGEVRGPPGTARPMKTMRMNLTVDIMTDQLISSRDLGRDVGSGLLGMNSYSRVGGRINMMGIVKRHVTVKMNCTMVVNVTSRGIQEKKCNRKVDL